MVDPIPLRRPKAESSVQGIHDLIAQAKAAARTEAADVIEDIYRLQRRCAEVAKLRDALPAGVCDSLARFAEGAGGAGDNVKALLERTDPRV